MNVPNHLLYTKDHEWALIEDDSTTVGLTDYAQSELGDVVFVELPGVGTVVEQGKSFGTIEAVKTVADLLAPMSGEVVEVNRELDGTPEKVNQDPYGEGWMIKIKNSNPGEKDDLLSPGDYKKLIG
ncbi:glycine cleavage system protein GcvH [candidate division KSB1 bacterium]|nr:glycine cleavage system protein GcvH [candidate division KSB1 bacterium]